MTYLWAFLFVMNVIAALLPDSGSWVDYFNAVLAGLVAILFITELRKEARIRKQRKEQLQ